MLPSSLAESSPKRMPDPADEGPTIPINVRNYSPMIHIPES